MKPKNDWPKPQTTDAKKRSMMRRASAQTDRYSISGNVKEGGHKPRPITLPQVNLPTIKE